MRGDGGRRGGRKGRDREMGLGVMWPHGRPAGSYVLLPPPCLVPHPPCGALLGPAGQDRASPGSWSERNRWAPRHSPLPRGPASGSRAPTGSGLSTS